MAKLDFVPSDHVIVGFFVKGDVPLDGDLAKVKEKMLALLRPWNGACWRCGHWLKYVIVTKHIPSDTFRALGEDCAEHLVKDDDRYQLEMLKEAAKRGRAEELNRAYRHEFSQSYPEIYYMLRDANANSGDHLDFVVDVARRFFGSSPELSDKQIDALGRCLAGRKKFEEAKAKRKAQAPNAVVPLGKGQKIIGEVIKTETKDTDFGFRTVFTVKTQEGWMVWGTVPTALAGAKVGDWVKFVANTEASDRDEAFGFFKRPRKAERLTGPPDAPITNCVECGKSLEHVHHNDKCEECRNVPF